MGIILVVAVLVFFVLAKDQIKDDRIRGFFPEEDSNKYAYQIDNLQFDGEDLVINGWFFELESVQNAPVNVNKNNELGLLLFDVVNGIEKNNDDRLYREGIECSVERFKREDVNEYFKCEYDYSNCGFTARIQNNKIDLENGLYQIIFKTDRLSEKGIQASAYIDKGTLKYVDPEVFVPVESDGTDIDIVVKNGYCLTVCPEYHMWIYQYKNELYWIADIGFPFEEDGGTYIPFHLDTTQIELLPEGFIENGWYMGNMDGNFEDNEVTSKMNCGKYRVSTKKIPQEYAVYWIETGYYNEGWIWSRTFRPII